MRHSCLKIDRFMVRLSLIIVHKNFFQGWFLNQDVAERQPLNPIQQGSDTAFEEETQGVIFGLEVGDARQLKVRRHNTLAAEGDLLIPDFLY